MTGLFRPVILRLSKDLLASRWRFCYQNDPMILRRNSFLGAVALFFVFTTSLFAQSEGSSPLRLSLEECLQQANQNNEKLKARGYAIEGAQRRRVETLARFKPIIEYSNRMAPVPIDADNPVQNFSEGDLTYFNALRVNVVAPIYAFGKLTKTRLLAEQGIKDARQKMEMDETELRYQVKQLYYGVLLGQELSELIQDALQKIDKELSQEETTQEHSPYQIAKLKVFKLELEKRLDEAQDKAWMAKEGLRFQIGLPEEKDFSLAQSYLNPVSDLLKPLRYYLELAKSQRPDLELMDIGVEAKKLEWELEKRKFFPDFGMGAFYDIGRTTDPIRNLKASDSLTNPFNYNRAGIGLEIRGQLDWHTFWSRAKRLRLEYKKTIMEASFAKKGINLDVEKSFETAKTQKENLRRSEERQKLARQMLFLSKSNLELGVGKEEDYTDALQLVLSSKADYLKTVFDYNVALAELDWKVGVKTDEKN